MSLFQCQNCGCCENTALSHQGFSLFVEDYDWTGIEDRKGMKLCSACGPSRFADGVPSEGGEWHGKFERVYLPMGMFRTASNGNLEHIETGDQDFRKHALPEPDPKGPMQRPKLLARMAPLAAFGVSLGWPFIFDDDGVSSGKTLDKINANVRDDEARKAKAEAKRRRRMERNRRLAEKREGGS